MRTVATAGHVDHGKSSLVRALTGTDPDRFAEEQERGLTIDLGFAFCTLPSGTEIGFVDVPGHVRFIKNMLAGVGAVDVAVLVVAATEGWMPQSEEHLRILDLLGVHHGVVVLSKADLVDDETLGLVRLEVSERVAGTAFGSAPIVAVDSRSGRGLDDVRAAIDAAISRAGAPADTGRPRLWVDRAFSARGVGTVVTGTLTGGHLQAGDTVVVTGSAPLTVRIRGIQCHGRPRDAAGPGERVALNLAGADRRAVHRGQAVVHAGEWLDVGVVDVSLSPLPGETLRERARLHAYVGSGEHRVWFRALDAGGRYARLRFAAPLPLAPGDRIVLRDPGSARTVAGCEVLDVEPRARAKDAVAHLGEPVGARVLAASAWLERSDLAARTGLDTEAAVAAVRGAGGVEIGQWLVAPDALGALVAAARRHVSAHHRDHPASPGIDVPVLASTLRIDAERLRAALDTVEDLVVDRGVVRTADRAPRASDTAEGRMIVEALAATPFTPPAPDTLGLSPRLVRTLADEGSVVVLDGVVFASSAIDQATVLVRTALEEHGALTIADVRDLLASTRKFVLPIVAELDRRGVTARAGDLRVAGPALAGGPRPVAQ